MTVPMGIKNLLRTEINVLLRRAARPVVAQRPRGIAVFLPQANARDVKPGDRLLHKGDTVRIVTHEGVYIFSDFGGQSRAQLNYEENVIIGGARAHDGLYFGEHIAFHQGCGTEFYSTKTQRSVTTTVIQQMYINDLRVF